MYHPPLIMDIQRLLFGLFGERYRLFDHSLTHCHALPSSYKTFLTILRYSRFDLDLSRSARSVIANGKVRPPGGPKIGRFGIASAKRLPSCLAALPSRAGPRKAPSGEALGGSICQLKIRPEDRVEPEAGRSAPCRGHPRRCLEPISTAFVKSTIHVVVGKRFAGKPCKPSFPI